MEEREGGGGKQLCLKEKDLWRETKDFFAAGEWSRAASQSTCTGVETSLSHSPFSVGALLYLRSNADLAPTIPTSRYVC